MRFVENPDFAREIDREVEFRAGKVRIAQETVKLAQSIAPKRTGDYARGIKVVVQGPNVYVSATHWTSHFLEWGTVDTPTFATIRRATRSVGLNLDELPRD